MSAPHHSRGTAGTVAVRAGALACLLLASLGVDWPGGEAVRPPLRLVDVSASMGPAAGDPDAATGSLGERILFADGTSAAVRGEDRAALPRERTRLAGAILEAAARLGSGPGRIVLVTDGRDTEGGALEAAAALSARGLALDVLAPVPPAADAGLVSARIESEAQGGPRVVRARVGSSVAGTVRVEIRRSSAAVDAREVALVPGSVVDVDLRDGPVAPADAVYEVVLSPVDGTPDDDDANDRLTLVARGQDPRVVVLDPSPWRERIEGIGALVQAEDAAPAEADAADMFVVSDLPWRRLGAAGAARLRRHVLSGGTLLLLGGPDAFGPGGWGGTALEALSPLRSRAPDEGETAVVLLLDASGSTGEAALGPGTTAHEALVEAALSLVDALPAAARALVVPFRDRPGAEPLAPGWVAASDAGARSRLEASLRSLVPAGGTDLPGAVITGARRASERALSKRRIVILLTDGDPDHALVPESFVAARQALAEGAAEFAAVVRGDAKAADALRSLARGKDGVVLVGAAGEFSDALARLFSRTAGEAEVAAGPVAVEGAAGSPYAAGLQTLSPHAVHRLEAARGAEVFAVARREGEAPLPFGASRSLGAGRVVALAWGPGFESPEGASAARRALAPLLSRLAREADRGLLGEEEPGRLEVLAPAGRGLLRARRGEGGAPASLLEVSPGRYSGPSPAAGEKGGDDALFVEVEASAGAWRPVRLPSRPPAEHRGSGVDTAALEALARAGGGRLLAPGQRPSLTVVGRRVPLAPYLATLAVALLLLDRRRTQRALERDAKAGSTPAAEAA